MLKNFGSKFISPSKPTGVGDFRTERKKSLTLVFDVFSAKIALKVSTNEKRGGLKVVAFDRSPFKVFSLRFSQKSVQAPSCRRSKTTQRSLFLSFEINNWFPITV